MSCGGVLSGSGAQEGTAHIKISLVGLRASYIRGC
jgi:hypothetical protein